MNKKTLQRIGFQIATFPVDSRDEAIEHYHRLIDLLNLETIEILFERARDRLWFNVEEAPPDDLRRLLNRLPVKGAHLPFIYINPIAPEPTLRKASLQIIKRSIDFAAECGIDYVVMHCRGFNYYVEPDERFAQWRAAVEEINEYATARSIILSLENADFLFELKRLSEFIASLSREEVKITLDIGHAHFRLFRPRWRYYALKGIDRYVPFRFFKNYFAHSSYGGVTQFIQHESGRINNLHLHDHDGKSDHLPPGKGKLRFEFLHLLPHHINVIIEARFNDLDEIIQCHRFVKEKLN